MNASPLSEMPAIGFLAEMEPSHRQFLTGFGCFVRPRGGDRLIEKGKPQENLYLVISGVLHVVDSVDGRELLIASLAAGDSLGEVNVFDPAEASASVVARSESLVWRISAAELEGFFEADPMAGVALMRGLLKLAGRRIRAMNAKLAESEQKSAMHSFWKLEA